MEITVARHRKRLYDRTCNRPEGTNTKMSGKLVATILALVMGALSLTGCGFLGQNKALILANIGFFFFSSRRRHTRYWRDWSSDVCSSDLLASRPSAMPRSALPTAS